MKIYIGVPQNVITNWFYQFYLDEYCIGPTA